ncbi:hypothetical protein, partial [Pseudoalteromonas sp. SIMBA_162]|uniref:hypothetical protein n=1 Tax=Pseudoalteromonas sp. SIMBA_162 TaxID=3080867 RepID=UPI0039795B8F
LARAETQIVITETSPRGEWTGLGRRAVVTGVRGGGDALEAGDLDWQTLMQSEPLTEPPVWLPAEAPFLQMFTSGTVGKP